MNNFQFHGINMMNMNQNQPNNLHHYHHPQQQHHAITPISTHVFDVQPPPVMNIHSHSMIAETNVINGNSSDNYSLPQLPPLPTASQAELQKQFMFKMNSHLDRLKDIQFARPTLIEFYKNDRRFIEVPSCYMPNQIKNESNACKMRIMTYNILADGRKYALSDYHDYCPQEYRSWAYRFRRICAQFQAYSPDIVCIQETTLRSWNRKMKDKLADLGYIGIHATRNNEIIDKNNNNKKKEWKKGLTQSDCVIYKSDRVIAIKHRIIRLKVSNKQKNKYYHSTFGSKKSMFRAFLSSYNDVAIVVHFMCKSTKKHFVVCSSHFYWDPCRPEMKAAQALILNHELKKLLLEDDEWKWPVSRRGTPPISSEKMNIEYETDINAIPIIFGVDANAIPHKNYRDPYDPDMPKEGSSSGVYELMSTGFLSKHHRDHPYGRINWREKKYQKELKIKQMLQSMKTDGGDCGGSISRARITRLQMVSFEDERLSRLSLKEVEHISNLNDWAIDMKWKSIYSMVNVRNNGKEPVFTNKVTSFLGTLDYIFISPMINVLSFLEMPYQRHLIYHILMNNNARNMTNYWIQTQLLKELEIARTFDLLPNRDYPSDHLPLCADVCIV